MRSGSNIIHDLVGQAVTRPDEEALVYGELAFTFKQLNALVHGLAANFSDSGIKPDDVVAMSFRSELHFALGILAIAALGATSLCVPISTPPYQRRLITTQAKCNRFLTDANLSDDQIAWKRLDFKEISPSLSENFRFVEFPSADLILAVGSGSTGEKKLMSIGHQVMRSRCEAVLGDPVLLEGNRLLCLSSLAFISVANRLFNAINAGITFVLLDEKSSDIFDLIERQRVTSLIVSVFHLEDLLKKSQQRSVDYFANHINAVRCVGSLLSEDLKRRVFDGLSKKIINSYATNETGVVSRTALPAFFDGMPNVGIPLKKLNVEVVDAAGRSLGVGEKGLIRIRSSTVINGYVGNEEASRKFFRDGWFYPGDFGEFLSDGSLLFHGRLDRMMICNGINIFPVEIEQALASHPLVVDCIAFPIRDSVAQDIPVCAVSIKSGGSISERDLIRWAVGRLGFAAPRRIFFFDSLPKTVEGKIQLPEIIKKITQAK